MISIRTPILISRRDSFSSRLPGHVETFSARVDTRPPDPLNIETDFTSETDEAATDIHSVGKHTDIQSPAATRTLVSETDVTHSPPPHSLFSSGLAASAG